MPESTVEIRAKRAAYMRVWNAKNRDRLNATKLERYHADGAFRKRAILSTRVAELRKRGGVDDDTVAMVPVIQGDPCSYCGEQTVSWDRTSGDGSSSDHIDPSGDSHWTNLTAACRSCNASKGDMPLLLSMLERRLRRDFVPIAEQLWIIKGRAGQRRRIDF